MSVPESGFGVGGGFSQSPVNIEAGEGPNEIRNFFTQFVYGEMPEGVPDARYEVLEEGPYLDSKTGEAIGVRTQTRITLSREGKEASILLLVATPLGKGPFPAIVSLNMYGNHSTTTDPNVIPSTVLSRIVYKLRERFHPKHRGSKQTRVFTEKIVKRGYALATAYYGDIMQDVPEGGQSGLLSLYPEAQTRRKDTPGALSVWASGMSRIADHLETLPYIDTSKMIGIGHSRLGKTLNPLELNDERFLGYVPVAAGKGGTALSGSRFGEPLGFMRRRFGHWFSPNFERIVRDPHSVPYDQDALLRITKKFKRVVAGRRDWWTDNVSQAEAVRRANAFRLEQGIHPIEFHQYDGEHEMPSELWDDGILDFADRITQSSEPRVI